MKRNTTPDQRCQFHERHQRGQTYADIAQEYGLSRECVRYWCRRQREGGGCETTYYRERTGVLSHFDPLVHYCILRLRLQHPRCGPGRLREKLGKRPSLRDMELPSAASIGRYLHQWPCFRRKRKKRGPDTRPDPPTHVHQRWQVDFKTDIALQGGPSVDLHTVRDPFGEISLAAVVHPTEKATMRTQRVPLKQVQATLRRCFDTWETLPEEIQTDGESTLVAQPGDSFPSVFTLWLKGLNITHLVIRPGKPTDNAEVERAHRTIHDYAIVGQEHLPIAKLQHELDDAIVNHAIDLPSRAQGCAGRSPLEAHPELLEPRRPFRLEQELAFFDLQRVDAFLATFIWTRKVGKTGQICLGGHHEYYSVGRAYAHQEVQVRFDPSDRHFVFYLPVPSEQDSAPVTLREIGRRPARNLEVEDLTELIPSPPHLTLQQLPLAMSFVEG